MWIFDFRGEIEEGEKEKKIKLKKRERPILRKQTKLHGNVCSSAQTSSKRLEKSKKFVFRQKCFDINFDGGFSSDNLWRHGFPLLAIGFENLWTIDSFFEKLNKTRQMENGTCDSN